MSFEEAVRRGEQLFGGQGFLRHDAFREAFQTGRIRARHVDAALKLLASEKQIMFGDRRLSHLDVLRATMVHGMQIARPGGELLLGQAMSARHDCRNAKQDHRNSSL